MIQTTPILFGRTFADEPQPMTCQGQTGWFSVPRQWYARQRAANDNQWEVSPNENFQPCYIAVLGDDCITRVYQDLLLEKQLGISN